MHKQKKYTKNANKNDKNSVLRVWNIAYSISAMRATRLLYHCSIFYHPDMKMSSPLQNYASSKNSSSWQVGIVGLLMMT